MNRNEDMTDFFAQGIGPEQQGTPGSYGPEQQGTPGSYGPGQQGTPGSYGPGQQGMPGSYGFGQQGTPGSYGPGQPGNPMGYPAGQPETPAPYYTGFYKVPLREPGTKRDAIFGGILFLLSLLCVNFCFFGGCGIALAVAAIGLFGAGLLYLLPHRRGKGGYLGFCTLSYMLCALSLVFSDSGFGKFLMISAMILVTGITLMELMDLRKQKSGTIQSIFDWIHTTMILPFEGIAPGCYALFHGKSEEGKTEKRKIGSVLIGLGCAVPVLLIVVPLLIDADAAFEGLLNKVSFEGGTELFVTVLFGLGLFLLYFGMIFVARFQKKGVAQASDPGRGLDTTFLTTFLSVISLVYVLYLVSQMAYFFNAFAGLLPQDFTVAQYARKGFFEMMGVCVINLGLLLLSLLGAKKKNGKEPGAIRVLSLFLSIFSLVLIATAMSKMVLYIQSFGMTYLRIVTSVFMIFLCVVFLTMSLWIFLRRLPYMRVIVIAAVLLALPLGFGDPARVVAGYNVDAYLSGKLDTVDMDELWGLDSHAVVPYVWKLREDPNEHVAERAWEILYRHGRDFSFFTGDGEEYSYDWRAFNVPSYKAYNLIKENCTEIFKKARQFGFAPRDLGLVIEPGVIKVEEDLSFFRTFTVEGNKVRIYCRVVLVNGTGKNARVELMGSFPEDKAGGLLLKEELRACDAENQSDSLFIVPPGRTSYEIVFIGEKGTGDQKAHKLLPEIVIHKIG